MTRLNHLGQPVGDALPDWRARDAPAAVTMEGRYCRLEPVSGDRHAADLFSALHDDPSGRQWTYMPYGPFDDQDAFREFLDRAAADPAVRPFTIIHSGTGRAEGMASYARIDPAVGSIEVGGIMFGPGLQRSPGATEAMYLMASYVFDQLGYRRYEWKCDSLNARSAAAARRLGFSYEGTWRNATVYKSRSRDTAWLAMTDTDWRTVRPVIREWLEPGNFVDGRQRTSLSARIRACLPSVDA